jgi:hypothetical protein
MDGSDLGLSISSIVVSVIVAWIIARHYYLKTRNDVIQQQLSIDKQQSSLESLGENTFRAIRALDPEKSGEIFKTMTGTWAQRWNRELKDNVPIGSDHIAVEYIPARKDA